MVSPYPDGLSHVMLASMDKATAHKIADLVRISDRYMPKVGKGPFAVSAAKYYPALKELAST